jgi:AbrB family looped-hinge helix DNA binding protein
MQTQISQYGNSLAIRIPKPFANDLGLAKGSEVDLTIRDGKIIIEVLHKKKTATGTPPDTLLQFVGRLPKENFVELLLVTRDRHFNAIDGLQLRVF